jgi:hypothetical protein
MDTRNPTGYAQVIQEAFSSNSSGAQELSLAYVYGLERISENRQYFTGTQSLSQTFYFVYDGHGSVRALIAGFAWRTLSRHLAEYEYFQRHRRARRAPLVIGSTP